jgi:hypothetical protein
MARRIEHTLGQAHRAGQLARISCDYCRITRYFEPADLERLVGDVPFRALLEVMRCEKCGRRDYLDVVLLIPTAKERVGIRVRRLADVRYVRRVIWE